MMTIDTAIAVAAIVLVLLWPILEPRLSHPIVRMSGPGAASTAPAPSHTCFGGASVSDRTCSIEGCAKPVRARGWCSAHYQRWKSNGDPLTKSLKAPHGARQFIDRAVASATDECIVWPYGKSDNGYGRVMLDGRSRGAHRVVLERTAGLAPADGMFAAHAPLICHNRACVNPRHLRWATPKQNMDDRIIDGESPRGERHGCAKLTAHQVLAIVRDPRTHAALAAEYGVARSAISLIKAGRSWGWLTHTSRGAI